METNKVAKGSIIVSVFSHKAFAMNWKWHISQPMKWLSSPMGLSEDIKIADNPLVRHTKLILLLESKHNRGEHPINTANFSSSLLHGSKLLYSGVNMLQTPNLRNSASLSPEKDWRLFGVIWIGQDVVIKLRSDQISFTCTSPCHNKIISGRLHAKQV